MVAGHLEVKKGYYYAVLSYVDVNGKRHRPRSLPDFPKRETSEKRRRSLPAFAVLMSHPPWCRI